MVRYSLNENWSVSDEKKEFCFQSILPAQIHDILLENGIIENPNISGVNQDGWIGEREWIYEKDFDTPDPNSGTRWNLVFGGIDTYADILLNGEKIGENISAYQSLRIENVALREHNKLAIRIHPPREYLKRQRLEEAYTEKIQEYNKGRAFRSGLQDFCGPLPDLVRMGIYGEVTLEAAGRGGFKTVMAGASLNSRLDEGKIHIDLDYEGEISDCRIEEVLCIKDEIIQKNVFDARRQIDILIQDPLLWYPRTHGIPNIYQLKLNLICEGLVIDTVSRQIGFRRIAQRDPMLHFEINNEPVRLYGACIVHPDTLTGVHARTKEKLMELLDLAELGNFNILRVWGESEIFSDDFYDECDRRGILVWQDFYLGWGMYNEEASLLPVYRGEAEELVIRLKHHPSILLWCGGNENYWSRDWIYPGEYCSGEKIFTAVYPDVVKRLDPERYYHVNSPSGGSFANDPSGGDTHGYTHLWYVPGRMYPEFLSENCRVSAPELRTMKKMMTPEELWPEGYVNLQTKNHMVCWPDTWSRHNTSLGYLKLGPVENYLDAETPEELIYRLGEAHSEYLKGQVERFRRGKPLEDPLGNRRCGGHILWKFNNNSNIVSFGVIDYFNEPLRAYYALKRAYEPFQVSFEVADKIGVWVVNDTRENISGRVLVELLELDTNSIRDSIELYFTCERDRSRVIGDLNSFGQFLKNSVLHARAYDLEGRLLGEAETFLQAERWMHFPRKGRMEAWLENGNVLCMRSDVFARSVTLLGEEDGDQFGWRFEDNYFDLFPGVVKRVGIYGKHLKGEIMIRPYYWEESARIRILPGRNYA